jgi:ATP-dependent Clp protease ATP-binding subunit ClpA
LAQLRQQRPKATLTQAQHAVALDDGFASWPKLKAEVERRLALPPLPKPITFQRYTLKAKQALFFARYEAAQVGSHLIEPEHIVLGLIRSGQGLKGGIVDRPALSLDAARATLVPSALDPLPREARVPFSEATTRVFRAAVDEADGLQHDDVGLAHILLGVLRERESPASMLLIDQGLGADRVRAEIDLLRDETPR